MNVSFTEKQAKYIEQQLQSGDFQNASEVVRDALRLHELYRARIVGELRAAIEAAWDGPVSAKTVKDIIAAKTRNQDKSR